MKDPKDWNEEDIFGLLTGEYNWLEAKRSQVIKPETKYYDKELLSKAVSAIANSGGGTLILGMKQVQEGKKWEVDEGGIATVVGHTTTREWLEDIIHNLVDPPLKSFNVYEIRGSPEVTQIGPGKAIYNIQIEDSLYAPHQAKDYRYYGRIAGKSRPLPHMIVMDIVNRRRYPILENKLCYSFSDTGASLAPTNNETYPNILISVRNIGSIFAQYVNSIIFIPDPAIDNSTIEAICDATPVILDGDRKYHRIIKENIASELDGRGNFTAPLPGRYIPILPGRAHLWRLPLKPDVFHREWYYANDPLIYWELYVDNAPAQKGEVHMKEIPKLKDVKEIW